MRELTTAEMEQVDGGMSDFTAGGIGVLSLSVYSPLTALFGIPIGLSMLAVGYYQ